MGNPGACYFDFLSLVWDSDWQLEGRRGESVCGRIQVCSLSEAPKTEIKVSPKPHSFLEPEVFQVDLLEEPSSLQL